MSAEYSLKTCRKLQQRFRDCRLYRPPQVERYDEGDTFDYVVTPVDADGAPCRVKLVAEKFVGGGFAGQVYKVRVLESEGALAATLPVGGTFALKILVPPSGGAELFRNLLYGIGFQGSFQPQTNPSAARAGAIWQKFIRRAAGVRFGDETCVNDVHATFVDPGIGSCGEISDWIEGRTWRLEVDDRVDLLRRWRRGKAVDSALLGSPEFRSKYRFMTGFVRLLNEMGAPEFARQYEWTTWKSQPNCLKRASSEGEPDKGLTAVDFRAGLTLLPFLPMSPGDFGLILKGLARGSLVQFDRGDLARLERFIGEHPDAFADMRGLLAELKRVEKIYRDSLIDVTHNHVRLLYSGSLWRQIFDSSVTGWRVRNLVDDEHAEKFRSGRLATLFFGLFGLIPFLGRPVRRAWGNGSYRRHYRSILTRAGYLRRAVRGKMAERAISWHRAGRITAAKAERVATRPLSFIPNMLVSFLPVGLHRLLTDGAFLKERLYNLTIRPVRLYFDADLRETWLRDMIKEGQRKRLVSEEDADVILSQIDEPFIQKYLKSLAVHVCTVPITQVVSLIVAGVYIVTHPDLPRAQAWAIAAGIVALFQVTPISPGSLVRGLYVLFLVIRERNFKDYNIAVFLGFFKYVGYLAFPIQMAYRYPTLARFMAAHWATNAVHIVPVFGESGALLEHKVFTGFYNVPLTLRGRMNRRAEARSRIAPRRWHLLPLAALAAGALGVVEYLVTRQTGAAPAYREIWWAVLPVSLLTGMLYTLLAGGVSLGRRIIGAVVCGIVAGVATALVSAGLAGWETTPGAIVSTAIWRGFALGVLTPIGAILTEVSLPEPRSADGS